MSADSGDRRYAVGVPSIDALHEECSALVEALAHALARGSDVQDALDALHEHLVRHFAHEESLMAATDFPPMACHQREHAAVLEVVAEVQKRYAAGDREPAARLDAAILEWFELHAGSMDAMLAQWLHAAAQPALEPEL